jgi:two-component system phosphate regulon response regulator PhoB
MTTDFFDISQGARLLVVDQDEETCDLMCGVLKDEGFEVKALGDGLIAWDLLQQEEFELIILDRKLPGVSGFDLCRKLRMLNNQSLILMTSGLNTEADRVMGLEVGADDYLVKPFGYREFLARCRALLRRHPLSGAAPVAVFCAGTGCEADACCYTQECEGRANQERTTHFAKSLLACFKCLHSQALKGCVKDWLSVSDLLVDPLFRSNHV